MTGDNNNVPPEWEQSLYEELRPLADAAIRWEKPGHSLQPTLLMNDAYLRLQQQENLKEADRSKVLAAAARIMRRLLIDRCRKRDAEKRGGKLGRVPFPSDVAEHDRSTEILELHEALIVFQKQSPRAAKVVELRFFGGLTSEGVAEVLDVSLSTVNSDWRFAKAWLLRQMSRDRD